MKLDKNKVREMAGKPPVEEQANKTPHVEPNRNRKRKQFTLSDTTRDQLEYLRKYHGSSESSVVDRAIDHYYEYVVTHKEPPLDRTNK